MSTTMMTITAAFSTTTSRSSCSPNRCANGGTCIQINGGTDYFCHCPAHIPLGGKNCDQLIQTTRTTAMTTTAVVSTTTTPRLSSCASNPCANGGTCIPINGGSDYICGYPSSFVFPGKDCK
ncbi:unnamed protein product [Rotaria sp. Silwood1]|nr:unnamed protein product [Rotaria sp. Silwood1]CAF4727522.1 unnamed protein product [Rotaria sp. Silwood1]CAF5007729.1 unnamed protein product [Rotaria sp. Silwood1]